MLCPFLVTEEEEKKKVELERKFWKGTVLIVNIHCG
jgi:hypothetical protein